MGSLGLWRHSELVVATNSAHHGRGGVLLIGAMDAQLVVAEVSRVARTDDGPRVAGGWVSLESNQDCLPRRNFHGLIVISVCQDEG